MLKGINEKQCELIKAIHKSFDCKRTLLLAIVFMTGLVFAQSSEQRQKANEYKCSFSCKMVGQSGRESKWRSGFSRSKTRGQSYQYSIRLNSMTQEIFTVETYFMASANRDVFAFAKDEQEIELVRGFSTNIVVCSPQLSSHSWGGMGVVKKRNYGANVVGVIGRLKKDGVIIKTHCSMAPWRKMAWQDEIEIRELNGNKKKK